MSKRVIGSKILATEITEKELDSGLVMPDTASTEGTRFAVFAIGDEVTKCTVGDTIYVPSQMGRAALKSATINYEGKELVVLSENNIVMVE